MNEKAVSIEEEALKDNVSLNQWHDFLIGLDRLPMRLTEYQTSQETKLTQFYSYEFHICYVLDRVPNSYYFHWISAVY